MRSVFLLNEAKKGFVTPHMMMDDDAPGMIVGIAILEIMSRMSTYHAAVHPDNVSQHRRSAGNTRDHQGVVSQSQKKLALEYAQALARGPINLTIMEIRKKIRSDMTLNQILTTDIEFIRGIFEALYYADGNFHIQPHSLDHTVLTKLTQIVHRPVSGYWGTVSPEEQPMKTPFPDFLVRGEYLVEVKPGKFPRFWILDDVPQIDGAPEDVRVASDWAKEHTPR